MKLLKRLLIPTLLVWTVSSLVTWLSIHPEQQLIGLRALPPRSHNFHELAPTSLTPLITTLETVSLWGVQRNGQPYVIPNPQTTELPEEPPWRVLGATVRKKTRYLLIQVDGKDPAQINEGENLPNGSTLIKVTANSFLIKTAEGKNESVFITP